MPMTIRISRKGMRPQRSAAWRYAPSEPRGSRTSRSSGRFLARFLKKVSQDILFGNILVGKFRDGAAAMHHINAVRKMQHLRKLGGHQHDRGAGLYQRLHEIIDFY